MRKREITAWIKKNYRMPVSRPTRSGFGRNMTSREYDRWCEEYEFAMDEIERLFGKRSICSGCGVIQRQSDDPEDAPIGVFGSGWRCPYCRED